MTLGGATLGRYPLGAAPLTYTTPPGQQIPPPVPGGTRKFRYIYQRGFWPLGYASLGGGVLPPTWPGGGLVIVPRPDAGVARVLAWWPDATQIVLMRIDDDTGDITPVRSAFPVNITRSTRRNYWQNPTAEVALNGYVPGDNNPTLTRLTDQPTARRTAVRATIAAAGALGLVPPVQFHTADMSTVALGLRISDRPTALTITFAWSDANGVALTPSVLTMSANAVNRSISQYARHRYRLTPPSTAAGVNVRITATGLPAGATLDIADAIYEPGDTDGSFVDGGTLGGLWTGAAGLSTSVIAPVVEVNDGECPFDRATRYQVVSPTFVGGRMESDPFLLESNDISWLTHPSHPSEPIPCLPEKPPELTRGIAQGTFTILGARYPLVVSGRRQAPTGTLTFGVLTREERDQLDELLDDGAPVLMRCPAEYGYGPGMWLSIGESTESAGDRKVYHETRLVTAPFQAVRPPAALNLVGAA